MEAAVSFKTHPWKSYSIISTISYYHTGQSSSVREGHEYKEVRITGVVLEAGHPAIGVFQIVEGEESPSRQRK